MTLPKAAFLPSRRAFVLTALASLPQGPRRVLDVGFLGDGGVATLHYAIRDALKPGNALVGIDVNKEMMDHFLAHLSPAPAGVETTYEVQSLFDCTFPDASFDAICLCEVLEHLDEPFKALRALTRMLRPGGILILTYPNPLSIPLFFRYLFQRDLFSGAFLDRFRGETDHLSFPHPASLAVVLRAMGYAGGTVAFMKIFGGAIMATLARLIPPLRKFSSYVGVCAVRA